MHGKTDWEWFKSSPEYRNFDRIDGEPMEFEWNIFPGFTTLQLSEEVKRLLLRLDETPENFTGRIIFMSMLNDFSCGSKDNEQECLANAKLVSLENRARWKNKRPVLKRSMLILFTKKLFLQRERRDPLLKRV